VAVPVDGGAEHLATVVRLLDERRIPIDDIGLRRPTLDEVFLALTGRPPSDPADDDLADADPADADPADADPADADLADAGGAAGAAGPAGAAGAAASTLDPADPAAA
jgi:ABC-2 type transport system ATP-binding protein